MNSDFEAPATHIDSFEPALEADLLTTAYHRALRLGNYAVRFATIERAPRYSDGKHENNAEHSFMLALIAPEVASLLRPDLDIGLVAQYATVHDLVELETGDVATFNLSPTELAHKEQAERDALDALLRRLPPYTAALLRRYEEQTEPEARYVRLIEKALPLLLNIFGAGSSVMHEVFGITTEQELAAAERACQQRLQATFPEADLSTVLQLRAILAERFAQSFKPPEVSPRQAESDTTMTCVH